MNERGQYGRQVLVGSEPVKTFAEGALVGGILVGIGALMLRHAVHVQRDLTASINAYRPRTQ